MNWQAMLTSDTAFIIYELIIFAVLLILLMRTRKNIKLLSKKKEDQEFKKQREGLDSQLSNTTRR